MRTRCLLMVVAVVPLIASDAAAQTSFVHWETPHVHPLDATPDGMRLLAVNTPDDRLEVFDPSGPTLALLFDVPVGLDPVSVRARTSSEVWVVNHVSDSVSIVDLSTRHVIATLATDDEPADVVFAGTPQRAFVSCSQSNTVLVFDPANLAAAPTRIGIVGEEPRAMAVSADGSRVYVAIFESGNDSTVLGGGSAILTTIGFPPNVVSDPSGPYAGQNPPPNNGAQFSPPINPALPAPPRVSLIVKKNAAGQWMDDNSHDWTALVSGPNAALSGRRPGWDLADHDVAILDASSLSVSYAKGLMNICMAIAVHPTSGEITVVGTDATNQVRFEPVVSGKFLKVELARVNGAGTATLGIQDLNPHLTYTSSTIPQSERNRSLGDPRGLVWNAAGTRGYVAGMGSNNVIVIDPAGQRAGLAPTIAVGEGPTGVVLDEARGRLYVLDKFEGAISVVALASELEVARIPFFDPSPPAIRLGRKHLYDTRKNSGLGQIACASCHVDARFDRLGWDLGNPAGATKPVAGQNLGAGIPGLTTGFLSFHPMKGPMTTQSLQDIVGNEPMHWRGDRNGLEEFNPAFVGLQGDDQQLTGVEMQQFEDFLATIAYPPNPYRNLDNTLPTNLPLPGHFTTGRFSAAGQPLPNGNAVAGLALYRPPNLLDNGALACATCHTLPTGMGTDMRLQAGVFVPILPGPNGERHHALVSTDGLTNRSMKIPQIRNEYEKTGFNTTQLLNTAGFGLLHDGSVDSIERFVSEPVFTLANDQQVADLVAFMLSFSGSELPMGSPTTILEAPGTASQDTHAAVGAQTTLDSATPSASQLARISQMLTFATQGKVGVVVKGVQAGIARGYAYVGGNFQSDRAAEIVTPAQLQASGAPGSELTFTVVPVGTEVRIGIDRDSDGAYDRDELDLGTDPADPNSLPGGCMQLVPATPSGLLAVGTRTQINLSWSDHSTDETGFVIERAPVGTGSFSPLALLGADVTHFPDTSLSCGDSFDYRVRARNCAGDSGFASASGATGSCCAAPVRYCSSAPNSVGAGAVIDTTGSTAIADNTLVLRVSGAVPGAAGVFFYGPTQMQLPFGDGFRCVGAGGTRIFRVGLRATADGLGSASQALDLGALAPTIAPGSTWNFQFWYLDPAGPGGSGFNLSDAVSATFCP